MTSFKDISGKILNQNTNTKSHHRLYFSGLTTEQYRTFYAINFNMILAERNESGILTIDEVNREVLNQMYYYLIGDEEHFTGELRKGLYLYGNVGWGKTVLLEALCRVITDLSDRHVSIMTARQIGEQFKEKGFYYFSKRPLFVDDIVKECLEREENKHHFIKLIEERYKHGSWTFLTSNYGTDTLLKMYGKMTYDRMVSMFNFIEVKGTSKRK